MARPPVCGERGEIIHLNSGRPTSSIATKAQASGDACRWAKRATTKSSSPCGLRRRARRRRDGWRLSCLWLDLLVIQIERLRRPCPGGGPGVDAACDRVCAGAGPPQRARLPRGNRPLIKALKPIATVNRAALGSLTGMGMSRERDLPRRRAVGVMREGKIGECARVRTSSGIFKQLPPDPGCHQHRQQLVRARSDAATYENANQKIAFGKDIERHASLYIFLVTVLAY